MSGIQNTQTVKKLVFQYSLRKKNGAPEKIETWGQLKSLLNSLSKKKIFMTTALPVGKALLDAATMGAGSAIASAGLSALEVVSTLYNSQKIRKTNTMLDKFHVDKHVSEIVDDTVENHFMDYLADKIKNEPDNNKIPASFNVNDELNYYLGLKYSGRHIDGITPS
jgi:hypothetical protein